MDKTKQQIQRFLDKVAEKYPYVDEQEIYTDIHVQVSQETGDIMAFDDDNKEITRCVVEGWISNSDSPETFYKNAEKTLRQILSEREHNLGIIRPYNYVLENESGEHIAEVYVVDDSETIILGSPFMQDLGKELDDFINNLLKE